MSNELSVQLAPAAFPASRRSVWLQSAGIVLAGSAFVALCANRALPLYFTPVPLTLQPFAVLLVGLLLTPRLAAATLLTYLAEGTLGLPVFAPTQQLSFGLAHLFGPTGGYLLAYPIAAPLISSLWRSTRRGFAQAVCCAAAGNFVILSCGAVWLAALMHASVQSILAFSVLPFLPGDALKIAAAAAIAAGYQRLRRPAA
jgi:biotin transport system substrate-specific component